MTNSANRLNTNSMNVAPLPQTPAEFGFIHQEQGPMFTPDPSDLPAEFVDKVDRPLHTQLLVTDQNNPVLITSLIGLHPRAASIAQNIEPDPTSSKYSDDIQAYFLKAVKKYTDDGPTAVTRVKRVDDRVLYNGNIGVSNGRLLRVYLSHIGSHEGISVMAKIGATRTKEAQSKFYKTILGKNVKL